MDKILKFLKDNPTYFLATVDADGNPQVRPFGTIAKFEDALYIQTGKVKECYKQMKAHPHCAISGMGSKGDWIRIECDLIEDERIEASEAVMADYPHLSSLYAPGDGNCTVFRLENISATLYSFTADPVVLL